MELFELTLHEASDLLRQHLVSSTELTKAVLGRIEAVEAKVKAFVTLTPELALEQARQADALLASRAEPPSPLTGIPMAIKDIICTKGIRTTCASRMLEDFIPPYDATVVEHLRAAGAVLVGKTNMDEFAMGSSTENSAFYPTVNPWATDRVPGGSSGGSAASVSSGEAFYALGTDTGGSVRLPASFCDLVGLKPTYGRVSRYGLVAFASSLDQIGVLAKDVTDCALALQAIAGYDPNDSTSVDTPVPDYHRGLQGGLHGLRLGVPKEYFVEGMQPEVAAVLRQALDKLSELGAELREVNMPHTGYSLPAYYLIAPAEASANLARYDGVKYGYSDQEAEDLWDAYARTRGRGFGPEVKRRIMLGTYALSAGYYDAYYLKAQKVRTLIKQDFDQAFKDVQALVVPTSPTVAFKLGDKTGDPLAMYLSDVCTLTANLAGIPGISIPCGFVDGLPVGMQILGPPFAEDLLLRVAYAYEQATAWHRQRPRI
ncbi:MAG: Asp-tRNA(Asn)/Glu-tRNA(Gln) amidotransferase subunit GatA [Chloroflexota bacterium]